MKTRRSFAVDTHTLEESCLAYRQPPPLPRDTSPPPTRRLAESRDACSLSALSINMRKKRQPVIWSVPHLPADACGLMAVPRGGVLVLSQNLLLYYAQVGGDIGIWPL